MTPLLRNDLLMVLATVVMIALMAATGLVVTLVPTWGIILYGGTVGYIYGGLFTRWSRERARLKGLERQAYYVRMSREGHMMLEECREHEGRA